MDNEKFLYDLLKEVREDQKQIKEDQSDLKTQLSEHRIIFEQHLKADEKMYQELCNISSIMEKNTVSLQEHMRRTAILEDMYIASVKRIDRLEEPSKINDLLKSKVLAVASFITAVGGAIAVIIKILK